MSWDTKELLAYNKYPLGNLPTGSIFRYEGDLYIVAMRGNNFASVKTISLPIKNRKIRVDRCVTLLGIDPAKTMYAQGLLPNEEEDKEVKPEPIVTVRFDDLTFSEGVVNSTSIADLEEARKVVNRKLRLYKRFAKQHNWESGNEQG